MPKMFALATSPKVSPKPADDLEANRKSTGLQTKNKHRVLEYRVDPKEAGLRGLRGLRGREAWGGREA